MIVPANQSATSPSSSNAQSNPDNVQMRHNAPVQLRRADSNKSGLTSAPNNAPLVNNLSSPIMSVSRGGGKPRPSQFQHNVTSNVTSVSSPSLLHSPSGTGPSTAPHHHHHLNPNSSSDSLPCSFHFICSRYFLFLIYLLMLLSLIINTFLHFIIYGSNMSIGALFLDVHHRAELVVGDYYSLDPHTSTDIYLTRDNWAHVPPTTHARPNAEMLHCDRDSFLTLLDEFYHHPRDSFDPDNNNTPNDQLYNNRLQPSTRKPYPKIFTTFNKEQAANRHGGPSAEEEQRYYSSSSTASTSAQVDPSRRLTENQWQRQKRNEQRLLIIEVAALILLFVLVLVQIIGLVAVMRKQQILLILVTVVDSLLFCLLMYVSSNGLLILLLLAIFCGFWFVLQLRFGTKKATQRQQKLKEEIGGEIRDVIAQTGARLTPCVHVSMEQYEAMTQQMMHRYSSPIVYCPHYNESLC